jgi:DMSO reductase anchor subunit
MRQGLLRQIVMYLMLGGHLAAIFVAPVLIANFSEALTVSLTILPVTAAIIMFIVQFHQENFYGSSTDEKRVSSDAAGLTLILSALSVLSITGMLYLYYIGHIPTIEILQRAVSLVDTGIIVYLILLLQRLFERQTP